MSEVAVTEIRIKEENSCALYFPRLQIVPTLAGGQLHNLIESGHRRKLQNRIHAVIKSEKMIKSSQLAA